MIISNVLVLALGHQRIASALINDVRFAFVFDTDNAFQAQQMLKEQNFDILILQDTLPGMDGAAFLETVSHAGMSAMPRVLLLNSFECTKKNMYPADAMLYAGASPEDIADAAYGLWQHPVPELCRSSFNDRVETALCALHDMGMLPSMKGTLAIANGAAIMSCTKRNDLPFQQWLYPHIGRMVGSSPSNVERNIRSAVEYTWLKGDLTSIQRYFGFSCDANKGKPTNAQMICTLAEYIRNAP